ncbi:MAG: hypothetical protein QM775_22385 [Pirellulales bacterium]
MRLLLPTLLAVFTIGSLPSASAKEPAADFRPIASAVAKQLAKHPGYRSGDLITKPEIAAALEAVREHTSLKLTKKQEDELVARGLDSQSFLAQQLTTKAGREFSRHIAEYQLGYDQLERLSKMPQGRSTVERLVRGPDGWKLLEYMAKAPGGHELNRMLSETPRGGNFEAATGRIYDEAQLLVELQKLHQASLRNSVRLTK